MSRTVREAGNDVDYREHGGTGNLVVTGCLWWALWRMMPSGRHEITATIAKVKKKTTVVFVRPCRGDTYCGTNQPSTSQKWKSCLQPAHHALMTGGVTIDDEFRKLAIDHVDDAFYCSLRHGIH